MDVAGGRFPLFTIDLKVAEATGDSPAKFVYSASTETLFSAVMSNFDNSFEMLKGTYVCAHVHTVRMNVSVVLMQPFSFIKYVHVWNYFIL